MRTVTLVATQTMKSSADRSERNVVVAVHVQEGRLDARVVERLGLVERVSEDQVVVLPTAVRANGVWYTLEDVATLKQVRHTGVSAQFADANAEYLHEYSAGWLADVSIAILGDIRAAVVGGIATALWLRARQATRSGTHVGAERDVPLRLTVTRRSESASGTRTDTVELQGATHEVIHALPEAVKRLDPGLGQVELVDPPETLDQGDDE